MKENTFRSHKRFTHTTYQQPLKRGLGFLFILEAKHKTLHVIWVWVELENSAEK